MIHIHLDPVGGMAGDMFVAAMIDAFPRHRDGMLNAVRRAGVPNGVACRIAAHRDHALTGKRFVVTEKGARAHHRAYREIAGMLGRRLPAGPGTACALAIYRELARAEAKVHGIPESKVTFHELGGWDSIADVVAAGYMYGAIAPATWSVGKLPLGSGRVTSAHGILPVPAPATALLLKGFTTFDDGVAGERVTPTGAAILNALRCAPRPDAKPRQMTGTGIGFGTRKLPGISNVLRVLVFDGPEARHRPWLSATVAKIEFEVDDQTPEDLAVGLDHLRAMKGVLDVVQWAVFGKKNRMAIHIQVLCEPAEREAVIAASFTETTTIGLRATLMDRPVLAREIARPGVKRVLRPGGSVTAKADIDAVAQVRGTFARDAARRDAADAAPKKIARKK